MSAPIVATANGSSGSLPRASDRQFREASRWGPMGLIAFALVILAGGVAWSIIKNPPEVTVQPAQDRWTGTDQLRFEAQLRERLDKSDRIIERLDSLVLQQVKTQERMLSILEKQEERLKAIEDYVRSHR